MHVKNMKVTFRSEWSEGEPVVDAKGKTIKSTVEVGKINLDTSDVTVSPSALKTLGDAGFNVKEVHSALNSGILVMQDAAFRKRFELKAGRPEKAPRAARAPRASETEKATLAAVLSTADLSGPQAAAVLEILRRHGLA